MSFHSNNKNIIIRICFNMIKVNKEQTLNMKNLLNVKEKFLNKSVCVKVSQNNQLV